MSDAKKNQLQSEAQQTPKRKTHDAMDIVVEQTNSLQTSINNHEKKQTESTKEKDRIRRVKIKIKPWSIAPGLPPIAFQIVDDRLLQIIHSEIENLHVIIQYYNRPDRMRYADQKISKISHKMIIDQKWSTKRKSVDEDSKIKENITALLNVFAQNPLYNEQSSSVDISFKVVDKMPDKKLLETNLPFVLPESIMLHNLIDFVSSDRFRLWTFKLDGIRLYVEFKSVGNLKMIIWANRKGKSWTISNMDMDVPNDIYKGTVWDAELTLLADKKSVAITIHDCLMSCGIVCGQFPKPFRVSLAHQQIEVWNEQTPSKINHPEPFFRPAYTIERWVKSDLVIRVKQWYSTRDVAFLLDRVMPYTRKKMDGLIGEAAEDSCLVKPKKYKRKGEVDLRLILVEVIDSDSKSDNTLIVSATATTRTDAATENLSNRKLPESKRQGIYNVLASQRFVTREGKVKYREVIWTEHGQLIVDEKDLPKLWNGSSQNFECLHRKVCELCIHEENDKKWFSFKILRDTEKLYPNEWSTVQATILNYRQAIKLDEIFPKELFIKGYRIPNAARVIELREKHKLNWHETHPEITAIPLPDPILHLPFSRKTMQKLWKEKCSQYSHENLIYMHSRVV
jgi:hypothetical protein